MHFRAIRAKQLRDGMVIWMNKLQVIVSNVCITPDCVKFTCRFTPHPINAHMVRTRCNGHQVCFSPDRLLVSV
jgi:hypothetical protein